MRTPSSRRLNAPVLVTGERTTMRPEGEVSAKIEGELWMANASVQATLHRGILAIAGFDSLGRGIGLALLTDPLNVPQIIGPGPATAMLTIENSMWVRRARAGAAH